MKKEFLYAITGMIVGIVIATATASWAVNADQRNMMQMMGMNTARVQDSDAGHMGMSMNQMSAELENRRGDDFDKNFIAMMIAHHQGALDMARLAETRAKHDEVKKMSEEIISAQTKEIGTMQAWQLKWNYGQSQMIHGH